MKRAMTRVLVAFALVCLTGAAALAQTAATETKKFEVIAVNGNELVVKVPEGTRELTVPDDFRFNVNGKMLPVGELKPGMAGIATITTKTTLNPVTLTQVKNGTVMRVVAGTVVIRTDEGIKQFTAGDVQKRGIMLVRDGKTVDVTELRTNDKVTATIITVLPPTTLTEKEVLATTTK
jgi:hypothetical protein